MTMKAHQKRGKSARKTFLVIGLLAAGFILLKGDDLLKTNLSAQNDSLAQERVTFVRKLALSAEHARGRIVLFGQLTREIVNRFH